MKNDRSRNALVAAALSLLISFGGLGCMVTGLKLSVSSMTSLALACLAASALSALCYSTRHGGWVLRGMALLWLVWTVWKPESLHLYMDQLRTMLHRMTSLWHNAYGWPVIPAGESEVADQPLMVIGLFICLMVCRTVCGQKRAAAPVIAGLLPLWSCLVVTDTVPEGKYLYMLLLGLTILMLSNSVRRTDLHQGLELTALASFAAAAGLALLFLFVPREGYVNRTYEAYEALADWAQELPASIREWSQENAPGEAQPVQPKREVLSTLGNRVERDIPVLLVTAQEDGLVYLRGQDFDSYNGKSWQATRLRTEMFPLLNSPLSYSFEAAGEITIDARFPRDEMYLPYYPATGVQIIGGRVSNEDEQVVYSFNHRRLPEDWREIVNTTVSYNERIFTTAGLYNPSDDRWRYRTLPLETKARAQEILEEILPGDGGTATGIADTIADYVRSSASYSLRPGTMPSDEEDFALWFLEDCDEGYCVHFATATAVLLRAAGVDARYVTGYILEAKAGQTVTVPASQAHAWVEYFEPRLGSWVVLEATPADLTGRQTVSPTQPGGEAAAPETTNPSEPENRPGLEPTVPTAPDASATQPGDGKQPAKPVDISGLLRVLKWLFGSVLTVAAVVGQRQLRLRLRRKRQANPNPNIRALELWQEAALLHRLQKDTPPEALEALAQKAKFSQYTLSAEELAAFRTDIRRTREVLQDSPWYLKVLHQFYFAAY